MLAILGKRSLPVDNNTDFDRKWGKARYYSAPGQKLFNVTHARSNFSYTPRRHQGKLLISAVGSRKCDQLSEIPKMEFYANSQALALYGEIFENAHHPSSSSRTRNQDSLLDLADTAVNAKIMRLNGRCLVNCPKFTSRLQNHFVDRAVDEALEEMFQNLHLQEKSRSGCDFQQEVVGFVHELAANLPNLSQPLYSPSVSGENCEASQERTSQQDCFPEHHNEISAAYLSSDVSDLASLRFSVIAQPDGDQEETLPNNSGFPNYGDHEPPFYFNDLEKLLLCGRCKRMNSDIVVLPCRHFCFCSNCVSNCNKCIVCGSRVCTFIKVTKDQ